MPAEQEQASLPSRSSVCCAFALLLFWSFLSSETQVGTLSTLFRRSCPSCDHPLLSARTRFSHVCHETTWGKKNKAGANPADRGQVGSAGCCPVALRCGSRDQGRRPGHILPILALPAFLFFQHHMQLGPCLKSRVDRMELEGGEKNSVAVSSTERSRPVEPLFVTSVWRRRCS